MSAIVVIAASEGALEPLRTIVRTFPPTCKASVFIVWHIGRNESVLPDILNRAGGMHAAFAERAELVKGGRIYVAPPDHHLLIEDGHIRLSQGPKINHARPSADALFGSAARAYGDRVIAVVLSGGDGDGAAGLRNVKDHGGLALVQSPAEAKNPSMPRAAFEKDHPDAGLPIEELARVVAEFCAARFS